MESTKEPTAAALIGATALLFLLLSCRGTDQAWFIDGQFSDALTLTANQARQTTQFNAIDAVEVLQVFESPQEESNLMEVDRIRILPLVLETRSRERIQEILLAAQDSSPELQCPTYSAKTVLHFLAFDSALRRVGYFRYHPCPEGGFGGVESSSGPAVFFTTRIEASLKRGNPVVR